VIPTTKLFRLVVLCGAILAAAVLADSARVAVAGARTTGFCPPAGAEPYKRDVKTLDYHLLDAGHFALETEGDTIAKLMRAFLGKHVRS
jgi:hypothetical protein